MTERSETHAQFTHAFANSGFHRLDIRLQKATLSPTCSGLFARINEIFRILRFFLRVRCLRRAILRAVARLYVQSSLLHTLD